MRYLCLIYLNEAELAAMPEPQMSALNARHLAFNEDLLNNGHFIEAEALEAAGAATCIRARQGRTAVTDGPYAETKEQLGGFYLIEARDLNEAIQVASRIPSAPLGAIEVRPCRDLIVEGVSRKASRKTR
ncbi:MAG: YciI family protein [Burkholderiaceae bacterium]|nr:YciI family protein [Burkholderiaceae bacterium]